MDTVYEGVQKTTARQANTAICKTEPIHSPMPEDVSDEESPLQCCLEQMVYESTKGAG